ncbi:MAG: bifunctional methylenetetrahydrofolate dehydrogenase/methenyltetrahydrofolate cyclohydrolase, partial [Parcubacteria group bacterium QH_9_35_7]
AILEVLNKTTNTLKEKNITIVGTGILVGKPTAIMLMNKEATVTTCNEFTTNLKQKCLQADIIISGVGKKYLIKKDMVPQNSIIIDVGVSYEGKDIYGDIQKENIKNKVSAFTPTTGGIGPITVAKLFENVVKANETIAAS